MSAWIKLLLNHASLQGKWVLNESKKSNKFKNYITKKKLPILNYNLQLSSILKKNINHIIELSIHPNGNAKELIFSFQDFSLPV